MAAIFLICHLKTGRAPVFFLDFSIRWRCQGLPSHNFAHKEAISEFKKAIIKDSTISQAYEQLALVQLHIGEKMKLLEMDPDFLERSLNAGFSGGEKKRNEILQMAILDPRLSILDETDSGLDIDALRVVANGVNQLHTADDAIVLVTHYQRLLNYIEPDYVHVMENGRIIKTGDKSLALELEKRGYEWVTQEYRARAA